MVNLKTWGSWCAFLYAEEAVTESLPSTTALVSKAGPGNSTATLSAGLLGQSWSATR